MSYFDIYKKRLNSTGNTSQERIQNSKEKEFSLFLNKSIYKVECIFDEKNFTGSLQPNKQYENKCLCTLLTKKTDLIPIGSIINIQDKEKTSKWIILYVDKYTKDGYNRYKVIEANRELTWTTDKVDYSSYVYLTGRMDKVVEDMFKTVNGIDMYREPENTLNIIIPTAAALKKDTYLEIEDEAWTVESVDKISVPGLSYVSLKQTLKKGESVSDMLPSESNSFWA